MDFGAHGVPAEIADEPCAKWIERGDAAIDVKVALFSRGEGECPGADGFLEEESFEI